MSNPSPTSATITWETDIEAGGLLRYRTAGTSDTLVTVQENRSLQRLHQVRLIGVLAANTTYEFEAESGGTVSATSTFRTTTSATFAPGGVVVADISRVGGALPVGAEEAMLFVTVKRFDDARRSFPLSVFTDAQGAALITLNLFNDADGQVFPAPRIGDSLFVDVRAGLLGSQKTTSTITTNSPEPIFLGSIVLQPEVLAGELITLEDTPASGTLIALDVGSNALTFSIVSQGIKGVAAITNAATGAYIYTPLPEANGVDTFTFKANDGLQDSNIGTVSVTIVYVNVAPSFTKGADQIVDEDAGPQTVSGWATNIDAGGEAGQSLTFTITGNTNPALFSAGPAVSPDGELTFTAAENYSGKSEMTLILQDDGGTDYGGVDTSPPQTFNIIVVEEPHVFLTLSLGTVFGAPGDTLSIPLTLSNPNEGKSVAGLQFAITAAHPEWVSYTGLADTSLHSGFVFKTSLMEDTLRVVAYSPTEGSIAPGAEIHLVTVLGLLDDAAPLGNTNQLFVSQAEVVDSNGVAFPDTLITGALQAGIPGDMNLSGKISVPDVVTLVRLNIGKTQSPAVGTFAFYIADANGDGAINVADAVYQVNRILGKPIGQPRPRVVYSPVTVDLGHPVTSRTGLAVPLSVITGTPVGGIQLTYSFDPSNITIGTPALTAASSDVSLQWHIEDGTLNVIAYSLEGKAITLGPEGVLIPVTVSEGIRPEITLTNAVLSDLYGNAVPVRLGQTRVSVVAAPTSFSLATARPNPFNPATTIAYEVLEQTDITLTVYNLLGQEVVRLVDQVQAAGRYEAVWNGTNISGVGVASGIYLYRITSGSGYTESKRMTLLK